MAGKEKNVVLPPELWKEILLKLWQSKDDLKHVLTCREVCHFWKELVDKMPPNPDWNPWFSDPEDRHHMDVFMFHSATNFTQDSDVTKFLAALPAPGSDDAGKNPFLNQTVLLFRYRFQLHQTDVKNEEENLLSILKDRGHRIRKLLWESHTELPERLKNLPLLLSSLTNLRILIVDICHLSHEDRKNFRGEDFPKGLKHLRELVFKCSFHGEDPDDTLYGKLSVNYGQQIKSITFASTLDLDISKKNVLECYPNLENLKVRHMHVDYWNLKQPSGNPWPKLRRLALRTLGREGSVRFKNVLALVRCFSETLELLSLQFVRSIDEADWQHEDKEPTVFAKLEKLILPLSTVYNAALRQPFTIPLERRLNFGLPALTSVVFEDMEDRFGRHENLKCGNPNAICGTLWPVVPSSVETISARNSWWYDVRLDRQFPRTYKYSRNQTN